jgi:23S rRNA (guanosine2251-2'-O)-methyltransferase
VTKDRPRNRPGNGGKQGQFGNRGPGGSRNRPDGERREKSSQGQFRRDGEKKSFGPQGGQKGGFNRNQSRGGRPDGRREAAFEENGEAWIWGFHAAGAALANPMRKISTMLASRGAAERLGLDPLPKFAQIIEPRDLDERLPPGAVHQGIAVKCRALEGLDISEAAMRPEKAIAILDQVTDPQNVGAIFRSAAAFGVGCIVMQTRNAPLAGGALAKAAAGALETVEEVRAVNISRAIDALTDAGWKVIGLDGTAELTLDQAVAGPEPVAIVLGAEGRGIRHGVAKACTVLARIPMQPGMESLNVSNAAAIAFYEAMRRNGAKAPPASKIALPADDDGFDGEAD